MARKASEAKPASLEQWEAQTRALLAALVEERDTLAQTLRQIDQRIETIRTALGQKPGRRPGSGRPRGQVAEAVLGALKPKAGSGIADIAQATGLTRTQINASLAALKKARKVRSTHRGVYTRA